MPSVWINSHLKPGHSPIHPLSFFGDAPNADAAAIDAARAELDAWAEYEQEAGITPKSIDPEVLKAMMAAKMMRAGIVTEKRRGE